VSGYSGTSLADKLGVREGHRLAYVNPPEGFHELVGELPERCELASDVKRRADLVVCFVRQRRIFEQRLPALRRAIEPDGMLWIAWPKKASGVRTDVTEDVIRDVALPTGLVDTKVCAIDDTWSGLRLVVRKELR
jgi:hypothetical protein